MNPPHFQVYHVQIDSLTPIHVGSGATIEPYEYDLIPQGDGGLLMIFNLELMLSALPPTQRKEFEQLTARDNFPGLRTWLRKNYDRTKHVRFNIAVQPAAYAELDRHQDNPDRLGLIELSTRDPRTGRPYLPGSSLKGAIRTALIDHAAVSDPVRKQDLLHVAEHSEKSAQRFEAAVMGNTRDNGGADLYRDPFRQIAIADAPLPDDGCYIDRITIVKNNSAPVRAGAPNPAGIQMYRDVTWSMCDGDMVSATTELRLHTQLTNNSIMTKQNVLPRTFSLPDICQQCNAFYISRLKKELERFNVDSAAAKELYNAADAINGSSNQCLIRLGRHSHFECVTISPPFSHAPKKGSGKTRSYVGGTLPLGWARMTFTPARS